MTITWWGKTCFLIKGEKGSLVINPPAKDSGFKAPKGPADILVLSEPSYDKTELKKLLSEKTLSITTPGEYDAAGFFVFGVMATKNGNTNISVIRHEQKTICHIASYQGDEISSEDLEQIGNIDILMISVGGHNTLTSKQAVKITNQIEPHVVIPMYYATPESKEKLDNPSLFLKELGASKTEAEDKFTIKKKESLEEEQTKVVMLNVSGV